MAVLEDLVHNPQSFRCISLRYFTILTIHLLGRSTVYYTNGLQRVTVYLKSGPQDREAYMVATFATRAGIWRSSSHKVES